MAWIEKRGSSYLVIWREPDGQKRSKSFGDRDEAKGYRATVELELHRGSYVSQGARREPFSLYLAQASSADLKSSTRYSYDHLVSKWVPPELGAVPIGDLTQRHFRQLFSEMDASPAVMSKVKAVLCKAVRQAMAEGVLPRDPLAGVKLPKAIARDMRLLTVAEVLSIRQAIRPRYEMAVALGAYAGLRLGEIGALRREDLVDGAVRVTRALVKAGGSVTVGEPKSTASRRTVALPASLWTQLLEHCMAYQREGWLFRTEHGGFVIPGVIWPIWREALAKAKVDEPLPRFHDLRHAHASWLIERGAHPKEIQARMGHSSIRMTMDVYSHLFPASDARLAAMLEEGTI